MTDHEYLSPDGQLRLLVLGPHGDLTVGFDGCAWHTHGSILAELSDCEEEAALTRFVFEVINGERIIALFRVAGRLKDAWPIDEETDPSQIAADLVRFGEPDETVEFRRWNGTKIELPAVSRSRGP